MYKLVVQKQITSDQILYNLLVSPIAQKITFSDNKLIGKYIMPLNNKNSIKKIILYKNILNKWLLLGLQLNKTTKKLFKEFGLIF